MSMAGINIFNKYSYLSLIEHSQIKVYSEVLIGKTGKIVVRDVLGRVMLSTPAVILSEANNLIEIDLLGLTNGMYWVEVWSNENNKIGTGKVVVMGK